MRSTALAGLAVAAALALSPMSAAANEVLNLYSARHYDTDERLYTDFTKATGIVINRIEDSAAPLIERLKAEGEYGPADILLLADVGMFQKAEEAGLLAGYRSADLEGRIPAHLRHPDGLWYGYSTRARVIFYDKGRIDPKLVPTYESLAAPAMKGLVCTRSATNVYMVSLLAAKIAHDGETKAEAWAKGLWANRARDPRGGDTDQLKAIASGECGVAIANTYYFVRGLSGKSSGLTTAEAAKIGVVFPDQSDHGTHVNISGAALLKHAPNAENAKKFLEYLASASAQDYFARGNFEYPAVPGVDLDATLAGLGTFKADTLPLSEIGKNQAAAVSLYSRVGYR